MARLYAEHFHALKVASGDVRVSITAGESTDVRDHSSLNIIQWNLHIAVSLGMQPSGCYIEWPANRESHNNNVYPN